MTFSTHVGGWNSFPLIARIQQIAGAPVVMDNDANAGALGEGAFGAGVGFDPLFYMTISTGIGGGIVSRGEVWRGADSYGGEIGHLTIQRWRPGVSLRLPRLPGTSLLRAVARTGLRETRQ